MSVFMPGPHNFDNHSFVMRFEIKKIEILQLVLFKDCLDYLWSLEVSYKFVDQFFCSTVGQIVKTSGMSGKENGRLWRTCVTSFVNNVY